jgi:hypothetical protein
LLIASLVMPTGSSPGGSMQPSSARARAAAVVTVDVGMDGEFEMVIMISFAG